MKTFRFIIAFFLISLISSVSFSQSRPVTSILHVLNVSSGEDVILREFPFRIEAPFWDKAGSGLFFNSKGKIFKISIDQPGKMMSIPTGFAEKCNNDHVLSPDGREIGISDQSLPDGKSRIYIVPAAGGTPRLITAFGPSYLHGWSPDGITLTYCAERMGNFDIYTIPAAGGMEKRLTTAPGLDDGPEYAPDGRYIWFNSSRKDGMQIWRMLADGTSKTQMTFDTNKYAWFPHISPDGQQVVYLTYQKGDVNPEEHLADKHVEIQIMPAEGGNPTILLKLFGGQGTMNVNSWSPDSKRIAYVSYR